MLAPEHVAVSGVGRGVELLANFLRPVRVDVAHGGDLNAAHLDQIFQMYLADVFTVTANLAGLPAISVPVGTSDGLPVGGQLIAPKWGESTLFRAAFALEGAMENGDRDE